MQGPKPVIPSPNATPILTTETPSNFCSLDCMSTQRLRSPIHLPESCMTLPSARVCNTRRRPKANSPRRRRVSSRVNLRITASPHVFDDLPWISNLDVAPEMVNPWDIADLSLLPEFSSSGPGPVRRRKSSLRSNSLEASPVSISSLPIRDSSSSVPTPRSRFIPSRVLFHNLMPVFCDS